MLDMRAGSIDKPGRPLKVEFMQFDEQTLRSRCSLSKTKIAHLQQRQRGGTSGQLGYDYQRRFALLRLVELAQTNPAAIVAMEALCPVDDVVVEDATEHEHAQCKMSDSETWSKEGKKLEKEFLQQQRLFQRVDISSYRLILVVADPDHRDRLKSKMPQKLAAKTAVRHFPLPSPGHHPWRVPCMAAALDRLLPPSLQGPSAREQLYKELNHAVGTPWQSLAVQVVLAAAARSQDLPVAMPPTLAPRWTVTPDEWVQASALLSRVPRLKVTTEGGVCCYRCGNESGWVARCDTPRFKRFVEDVIAHPPQTMEDFLKVRPV